jgi:LDH2 family malate/lactate/ureidoglycolate dehydrogenase
VAAVAIGGSNHCGAMAYCAMRGLAHDVIGIATSNALPTMAPWGGRDKILGINPLAVAIPAGAEPAVVFDAAFSGSSHGKIRVYQRKGLPIPDGWAFDVDGRPTNDAARAIAGLLQPIGGFKGTGLALVMGLLSTMLSGAAYGTELGDMVGRPRAGHDGHFVMALDVAAFEDMGRFKTRVDRVVRQIREGPRASGVERIYPPGHLELETEARYRREGIPLNAATVEGFRAEAARHGVEAVALGG